MDVGAKAAIHALIDELAQKGLAVMLISSELPEVLNLSTRVIVMREGSVAGELSRAEMTQARVSAPDGRGRRTGDGYRLTAFIAASAYRLPAVVPCGTRGRWPPVRPR